MNDIDTDRFVRLAVVGLDGSDGSRTALDWAIRMAGATDAEVIAAHVLTYDHELFGDVTPDTMRAWRRELERELNSTWTEPLRAAGVDHRAVLVHADSAARGLLDLCDEESADLLVIGTHGHGTLAGRLLGSTSYRLTHHAHQPVIVVPPDWPRRTTPT